MLIRSGHRAGERVGEYVARVARECAEMRAAAERGRSRLDAKDGTAQCAWQQATNLAERRAPQWLALRSPNTLGKSGKQQATQAR